jgi:hypothetical protein
MFETTNQFFNVQHHFHSETLPFLRLSCRRDQQRAIGALLFVLLGNKGVAKNQSAEICQFASAGSGKNDI